MLLPCAPKQAAIRSASDATNSCSRLLIHHQLQREGLAYQLKSIEQVQQITEERLREYNEQCTRGTPGGSGCSLGVDQLIPLPHNIRPDADGSTRQARLE